MNAAPDQQPTDHTSRMWPFYALLADVAVMAVVIGASFFDDGLTAGGATFVATAVGSLVGIALWLNRQALAKPLSFLVGLMGIPLCFLLAMAALAPFFYDYDGPPLGDAGKVIHGVAFLLVVANLAFVGAALWMLKAFDTRAWLE